VIPPGPQKKPLVAAYFCESEFALLVIFLFVASAHAQKVFNILNYGAEPDTMFINTNAINKAIKACNKAGGGIVVVPSGTFLSGTINLLSNVDFHLEIGATIKGSDNRFSHILFNTR
jgi:polygalacturonase